MAYETEGGLEYEIVQNAERWVRGALDGLWFEAKIDTEPNDTFGLDGTRVVKLSVTDDPDDWDPRTLIMNYDLAWDVEPETEEEWQWLSWLVGELDSIELG